MSPHFDRISGPNGLGDSAKSGRDDMLRQDGKQRPGKRPRSKCPRRRNYPGPGQSSNSQVGRGCPAALPRCPSSDAIHRKLSYLRAGTVKVYNTAEHLRCSKAVVASTPAPEFARVRLSCRHHAQHSQPLPSNTPCRRYGIQRASSPPQGVPGQYQGRIPPARQVWPTCVGPHLWLHELW
jgi:hypothetical protein